METATDGVRTNECSNDKMTELQRELELFEASERHEDTHFLSAIRPDKHQENQEGEEEIQVQEQEQADKRPPADNIPGKKKRGRKPKSQLQVPFQIQSSSPSPSLSPSPSSSQLRKKAEEKTEEGEDVCFVCFDGGDLVLCDRKSCTKAYHPNCVGRDEAFFQTKGPWTCGWHLCSVCEKPAKFLCYTCTYSVCDVCVKDSEFLRVRKNRGFCENCMQLVLMIEENKEVNSDGVKVDFSDKETWEYLFKDYWIELKDKLSLTLEEILKGTNPFKDADFIEDVESDETFDGIDASVSSSDSELHHFVEEQYNIGRKRRRRPRKLVLGEQHDIGLVSETRRKENSLTREFSSWASKELLEFIGYLKEDAEKSISLFEVQQLLLTYIKENRLQDPRKKSLIICDERLRSLFGKPTVGQFEMLKLLESHLPSKQSCFAEGNSTPSSQGPPTDNDYTIELDDSKEKVGRSVTDKRRKSRKKMEDKVARSNPNDFAAINVYNIGLIYLRRTLIEDLLEDLTSFNAKIVGSFVRIRISGGNRQEVYYRLVQVVGTKKVGDAYNTGRKITDIILEILNLTKKEDVSIDAVSNQDFTEEECKRLRQSVRCGLVHRPTVSELEEKAKALHEVKLNDWFETELLRLSHLRDRASEKGLRKELRECVEKLQLLSSPDERARKLLETPDVIADPNVDPGYDSDDDKTADNNQGTHSNQWDKGSSKKGWDGGHQISTKTLDNSKRSTTSWGQSGWERGPGIAESHGWSHNHNDNSNQNNKSASWNWGTEKAGNERKFSGWESQTNSGKKSDESNTGWKKNDESNTGWKKSDEGNTGWSGSYAGTAILDSSSNWQQEKNQSQIQKSSTTVDEFSTRPDHKEEVSETEKVWHYKDPTGKIQGPFSMLQLRKWNTTGFFPIDLRIWKTHEMQDDSILLTDALASKFGKESNAWEAKSHFNQTSMGNKVAAGGKNPNAGWRGNGVSTWMGTERNNISPQSNWQMDTGCGSSANAGELTRTTDHQSFGWDNSTDIQKLRKSETDGWGAPQSSGNTWTAPSSVEAPPSSNEGLSGPLFSSQSTWAVPSTIEAPKSADAGWGGGTNEVLGAPKSSGGMLSIPSTVEAPKSSEGSWLGGPKEGWGGSSNEGWGVPKSSASMWSSLKTPETSNSAKGGWVGGHVEGRGTPQSSENIWKDPSTNLVEAFKSTNQGWGASQNSEAPISSNKGWDRGPDDSWGASQNSEIVLSTQTVEVPKSTSQDWGGGPTEGWVATTTQCSDSPWKVSSSVIVDTPKCPKESWGDPQSSENMFSAPAPKSTTDSWGAPPSSENLCATVSAGESSKSTNECWGAPQSSEKSWTAPSTVEACKTRSEGWGSGLTEGWGSSGGWDQASGRTENTEMGKVAGMGPWSTQTSCHDSSSAGKFHNRPPNDGFRPPRNSKKDTPCRFHERGFCRKGSNCEFRHG